MFHLIVQNGRLRGRRLSIRGATIDIGSAEDCPLRLQGEGVALRHARIEEREGGHDLTGLAGDHPLRINGAPVTRHRLRRGDVIGIGEFEMVYEPDRFARTRRAGGPEPRRRGGELVYALVGLFLLLQSFLLYFLNRLFFESRPPYVPPAMEQSSEP